jgi:hypothetical protein
VHPDHDDKVPIEPHHVRPRPRGGGDSQMLTLCANAHGRVHHLLDEIESYAEACPYATPSEVIRQLPPHVWTGFTDTDRRETRPQIDAPGRSATMVATAGH